MTIGYVCACEASEWQNKSIQHDNKERVADNVEQIAESRVSIINRRRVYLRK
jgi:hypothetical protein